MKFSDDYRAKYHLWAQNPQVIPAGEPVRIPNSKSKRFRSHEEMNRWKDEVVRQMARSAK